MVRRGSSGAAWVGRSTGWPLALVGVVAGVVLLLATALLVGGCSGSEAEQPSGPGSPSVSSSSGGPSPSGSESSEPPSVGVPVPPSAMRSADEAGAEAFVRHYFALVNYAQATGDLEPLRAVSGAGCSACQGGIRWLAKVARKRWIVEGGEYQVRDSTFERMHRGTFVVTAKVASGAQRVVDRDGTMVEQSKAGTAVFDVRVAYRSGSWTVLRWEFR